jgi:hypothetical protein
MDKAAARRPERVFTATFALIVSAIACAIVVLAAPRPVAPAQLPALRLDRTQVAAQAKRDEATSVRAPRGADIDALLRLYRAEGRAEATGDTDFERLHTRRAELAFASRTLFARLTAQEAFALVTAITTRALAALRGELDDADEARGLLGGFPALLAQYGYADARGLRAPVPAVRGFYKERFNLICERPRGSYLTALEQKAYDGFNALHAGGLPPELRAAAARAYEKQGGEHGAEANAIWMFQAGMRREALAIFRREYGHTHSLRLRNMALFAARAE